jgi:putative flippase GtrA
MKTFGRAQITALLATAVDYSSLIALVELAGMYYVHAVAIAAAAGALTNFFSNRLWAFAHDHHGHLGAEALRYGAVSLGSLGWNVFAVFLFTDGLGIRYFISKIITAVLVGVLWNYPLHKHFVFREEN